MKIPRADSRSAEFFRSIVPADPRVKVRPMFGNLAAFLNGNMFLCLLGSEIALRLSDSDRHELLKEEGASIFEVVKGRPMKEYVTIPKGWQTEPQRIRRWLDRSVEYAGRLPPKS